MFLDIYSIGCCEGSFKNVLNLKKNILTLWIRTFDQVPVYIYSDVKAKRFKTVIVNATLESAYSKAYMDSSLYNV